MIPKRVKKTQSSPNLANVCVHKNDIALANFPKIKFGKILVKRNVNYKIWLLDKASDVKILKCV